MWDSIFKFVIKSSSLQPVYTKEHCIAFNQSMSACKVCKEICPHEAISFKRGKEVQIDDIDCTGCGLCVQMCPSQALETKLAYQTEVPLKCSQVKGSAQSVQCLGRLSSTDLLRLAGRKSKVTLVRNDCADCKIGTEATIEELEKSKDKARVLAKLKEREIDIEVLVEEKYDATDNPAKISRRDLLRGGLKNLQATAADALAPLDPGGDEEKTLPKEMQRHYRIIESSQPEKDDLIPWVLPRVADGCVMCPVCTKACPTGAFKREFHPEHKEGSILMLEPEKCNGCNACVKMCPTKVISLDDQITWGELSGGIQEAFYKPPYQKKDENISR